MTLLLFLNIGVRKSFSDILITAIVLILEVFMRVLFSSFSDAYAVIQYIHLPKSKILTILNSKFLRTGQGLRLSNSLRGVFRYQARTPSLDVLSGDLKEPTHLSIRVG